MSNSKENSIKCFIYFFSFSIYILLYLYCPLNSIQQELIGYDIVTTELESVDVDPSLFEGPTTALRNNEKMFLWKFEDGEDTIFAYVKPIEQRILQWKKDLVVYRSNSDRAWEKASIFYRKQNTN